MKVSEADEIVIVTIDLGVLGAPISIHFDASGAKSDEKIAALDKLPLNTSRSKLVHLRVALLKGYIVRMFTIVNGRTLSPEA